MKTKEPMAPMAPRDQAVIKWIAVQLMDWAISDRPVETAQEEKIHFFFADDQPIKAVPYPTRPELITMGASPFGLTWENWNLFKDPHALSQVIMKVLNENVMVEIGMSKDFHRITIRNDLGGIAHLAKEQNPARAITDALYKWACFLEAVRSDAGVGQIE